jgi:conjugal transfer pilus assembly protein TraE
MRLCDFMTTFRGLEAENSFGRWIMTGLLLSNLLALSALFIKDNPVIVIPPTLHDDVRISQNQASSGLKEAWGLFIAGLLGNVTPGNNRFIEATIAPLLDAVIYPAVMAVLWDQIEAITIDRITLTFKPHGVFYEAETDKVFVSGVQTSQGPGGSLEHHPRTYEFVINFRHYRPVVTAIDVYPDEPRTKDGPSPKTPLTKSQHRKSP